MSSRGRSKAISTKERGWYSVYATKDGEAISADDNRNLRLVMLYRDITTVVCGGIHVPAIVRPPDGVILSPAVGTGGKRRKVSLMMLLSTGKRAMACTSESDGIFDSS